MWNRMRAGPTATVRSWPEELVEPYPSVQHQGVPKEMRRAMEMGSQRKDSGEEGVVASRARGTSGTGHQNRMEKGEAAF